MLIFQALFYTLKIPARIPPQTPPAGRIPNLAEFKKNIQPRKSGIRIPKTFVSAFPSPLN